MATTLETTPTDINMGTHANYTDDASTFLELDLLVKAVCVGRRASCLARLGQLSHRHLGACMMWQLSLRRFKLRWWIIVLR